MLLLVLLIFVIILKKLGKYWLNLDYMNMLITSHIGTKKNNTREVGIGSRPRTISVKALREKFRNLFSSSLTQAEHVSRAWTAEKPLSAQAIFVEPRSAPGPPLVGLLPLHCFMMLPLTAPLPPAHSIFGPLCSVFRSAHMLMVTMNVIKYKRHCAYIVRAIYTDLIW